MRRPLSSTELGGLPLLVPALGAPPSDHPAAPLMKDTAMTLDDLALADGFTAWNGLAPADALQMLRAIGIDADLGEEFPCLFAADPDALAVVDRQSLRYQTLYEGAPFEWASLAEVLAGRINGRPVSLAKTGKRQRLNVLHARWWDRLRYQAGLLDLDVPELELPESASMAARHVAAGFALAYALNALHHGAESALFSRRFVMQWTGLPERAIRGAMRELLDLGVIAPTGRHAITPGARRPAPLYLPVLVQTPTTQEPEHDRRRPH